MPKKNNPRYKNGSSGDNSAIMARGGWVVWATRGEMMTGGFHAQRKEARVYFSPEENIRGVFVFPDFERFSFSALVLDLGLAAYISP